MDSKLLFILLLIVIIFLIYKMYELSVTLAINRSKLYVCDQTIKELLVEKQTLININKKLCVNVSSQPQCVYTKPIELKQDKKIEVIEDEDEDEDEDDEDEEVEEVNEEDDVEDESSIFNTGNNEHYYAAISENETKKIISRVRNTINSNITTTDICNTEDINKKANPNVIPYVFNLLDNISDGSVEEVIIKTSVKQLSSDGIVMSLIDISDKQPQSLKEDSLLKIETIEPSIPPQCVNNNVVKLIDTLDIPDSSQLSSLSSVSGGSAVEITNFAPNKALTMFPEMTVDETHKKVVHEVVASEVVHEVVPEVEQEVVVPEVVHEVVPEEEHEVVALEEHEVVVPEVEHEVVALEEEHEVVVPEEEHKIVHEVVVPEVEHEVVASEEVHEVVPEVVVDDATQKLYAKYDNMRLDNIKILCMTHNIKLSANRKHKTKNELINELMNVFK